MTDDDLGAGCGWPGLYLAENHGCALVSLDPVAEGVRACRARGLADGLSARTWANPGLGQRDPSSVTLGRRDRADRCVVLTA